MAAAETPRGGARRPHGLRDFRRQNSGRPAARHASGHQALAVLLALGLIGAQAQGPEIANRPLDEFVICVNMDPGLDGSLLPPALAAGILAAARHLSTLDCDFLPGCESLFSGPVESHMVNTFSNVSVPLFANAQAAINCKAEQDGDLFVLGQNDLVDTIIPVNVLNGVPTAAPVLSRPSRVEDSLIRTYLSPETEAEIVVQLLLKLNWRKTILLYDEGDEYFAEHFSSLATAAGVETLQLLIASDFVGKLEAIQSFGSSIILVASLIDIYGSVRDLTEALDISYAAGLLEPRYTWLGVHRMSQGQLELYNVDLPETSPLSDRLLSSLLNEMIFIRPEPILTPRAALLWDSLGATADDELLSFFPDTDLTTFKQQAKEDFLVDFSVAYDTVWLMAAAYAKFNQGAYTSAAGCNELDKATSSTPNWAHALCGLAINGTSGPLSGIGQLKTTGVQHEARIFMLTQASERVVLAYFNNGSLNMEPGQTEIPWRDGTSYPKFIPTANISQDSNTGLARSTWVVLAVALVLLLLLACVVVGYIRLKRSMSSISHGHLDLDSPVTKAVHLLTDVSHAIFISQRQRNQAEKIASALLKSEDVHAPDLTAQMDKGNEDIMAFIINNATGADGHAGNLGGKKKGPPNKVATSHTLSVMQGITRYMDEKGNRPEQLIPSAWDVTSLDKGIRMAMAESGTNLFFDTVTFASNSDSPLLTTTMCIIKKFNLIDIFDLHEDCLVAYLTYIEAGYNDVPYHNASHAADMLSRVVAILYQEKLLVESKDKDDKLLLLAVIIAAAVHDFQHPGLSNAFQVATDSYISREFNEQMVLENVSLHRSLQAMRSEPFCFVSKMPESQRKELSSVVIRMVLATDMSRHFDLLGAFKGKVISVVGSQTGKLPGLTLKRRPAPVIKGINVRRGSAVRAIDLETGRNSDIESLKPSNSSMSHDGGSQEVLSFSGPSPVLKIWSEETDNHQKTLILQLAMKIADVGHMTTHYSQHIFWSQKLEEEFFAQGDKERELELPISPLMNRLKPGVMDASNQLTFCSVIVLPMLEAWSTICPIGGLRLTKQTQDNINKWTHIRVNGGSPIPAIAE